MPSLLLRRHWKPLERLAQLDLAKPPDMKKAASLLGGFFVVIEVEVLLRRFFADLGCKGKQIGHLVLGSVQRFPKGPIF